MNKETASELSFEEALARLEAIVKHLEKGDASLEELLTKFSEGVGLSQLCLGKLDSAEQAVNKILQQERGQLVAKPLVVQEEE